MNLLNRQLLDMDGSSLAIFSCSLYPCFSTVNVSLFRALQFNNSYFLILAALPPSLNFLSITGNYAEGGILTASYGYIGGHEGKSIYNWYLHEVCCLIYSLPVNVFCMVPFYTL